MSVVGVDFGNLNTVIAVARNRGIDVICNEVSNRATPSLVAFGPKNRFLGEPAKSQEISNLKNTVGNLKRLFLGAQDEFNFYKQLPDGRVLVMYQGEERTFSPVELAGMFFTKVKETCSQELQSSAVHDIVMSCPAYFTDSQLAALMAAAQVGGLRCVRMLNDSTAAALCYGMTKAADLDEEKPRHVLFVDMGHANLSVAIVSFWKTRMEVRSVACDANLGGRDFDRALAEAIAHEIRGKTGIDVLSAPAKVQYRLRVAAERAKKILSANLKTAVHVESIAEDQDYATDFTRDAFEALIESLLVRVEATAKAALESANIPVDEFHSIELIGGSVRIPAVKERVARLFNHRLEPGSTMNQDEAVARGCALQAAILSPTFKSRPYAVQDCVVLPIRMSWEPTELEPADRDAVVFPAGNGLPSTKLLSFTRPLPFLIDVSYALSGQPIGQALVGSADAPAQLPENGVVKVKAKMSLSHMLSIESAQIVVEEEVVEGEDGAKKTVKKKTDVPVEYKVYGEISERDLSRLCELEGQMYANDRLVKDTENAKNAVEEYIYMVRGRLSDGWSALATDQEKAKLLAALDGAESWLYEDGEDATKSAYQAKLKELTALGDPIKIRHDEAEERPRASARLLSQVAVYRAFAEDKSPKYAHISPEDRLFVTKACDDVESWLSSQSEKQANQSPWDKPVITSKMIDNERDSLINKVAPIMLKPKPSPSAESTTTAGSSTGTGPESTSTEHGN